MEKIERILERYKTYSSVKDVKLVVKPYKTRTAFSDLTNRIIPVHHYQPFSIFIFSTFSFGIEVQNAVELLRVGQVAAGVLRAVHVKLYVYQLPSASVCRSSPYRRGKTLWLF
jgi:hypothetical protein